MSSLLSFARAAPPHRVPRDEEAAIPSSSQSNRRWSRAFRSGSGIGFGIGSSSANHPSQALEMSSPSAPANNDNHFDMEQAQPRHERATSGRSLLSAISVPSLSALRQRERDQERQRQDAHVQSQHAQQLGATISTLGGGNALAPILLAPSAAPAPAPASRATAVKKSRSSRREREEAATLFGPNLANYFGSGISSSGAVSSHGAGVPQPAAVVNSASPTLPAPTALSPSSPQVVDQVLISVADPATPAASYPHNSASSRRARLGSRGRARGASLSGLSMMSLGAESVTSLGGIDTERTNDPSQPVTGMMQGSTADLIHQLNRDAPSTVDGSIAMSEGVDISTLQRWIQRSTGIAQASTLTPTPASASAPTPAPSPATHGPPVCTTLQSYVNLKRNTLKLSLATTPDANVDTNMLRSRASLSVLPNLSCGSTSASASLLPEPTHSLYFEYDCAAPFASVQIFIRASRKHGSWVHWTPPGAEAGARAQPLSDGSPLWLAQCGPPPHALGWPVHVAKLKKGFGVGHTANVPLHLQFYAPPRPKKAAPGGATVGGDLGDERRASAFKRAPEPPTPAAIPETPGFEFNRRLEADAEADDADEDANANTSRPPRRAATAATATATATPAAAAGTTGTTYEARTDSAGVGADGLPSLGTDGLTAAAVMQEETREQRLAREKAERETLKVAIVVEALDENGRPLLEPNLQTSYVRLTSLASKRGAVVRERADATEAAREAHVEVAQRTWSSQVEGQEAEIGPHRFQLQELYGLSSKPPAVAAVAAGGVDGDQDMAAPHVELDASNGSECLICLSSPPTTLLLPCTHGLCLECAVQLRDSVVGIRLSERRRGRTPRRKFACPVCRRAYTSMLHLSRADEKVVAQHAL